MMTVLSNVSCIIHQIMKKTYIYPTTIVVNVQPSSLIANSLPINPGEGGGGQLVKENEDWDIWGDASTTVGDE